MVTSSMIQQLLKAAPSINQLSFEESACQANQLNVRQTGL